MPRIRSADGSAVGGNDLDPALLLLFDELARRIDAGEAIDAEQVAIEYPRWSEEIRVLLPTLYGVAALGRDHRGAGPVLPAGGRDAEGRKVFGDFRIVREIGRGGMGVVYEAEQVPLGRRVALKVIAPAAALDPRAVQRFQLEAHVAGLLQHPNIVPIHAVGAVGETPYYAMQYVDGESLAHLIIELRGLTEVPSVSMAPPSSPRDSSSRRGGGCPSEPSRDEPAWPASGKPSPSGTLALGLLTGYFDPRRESDESGHTARGPGPADPRSVCDRAYIQTIVRLGIQAAEALGYAHDEGIIHRDVKPANLLLDMKGDVWIADFGMADVQGDAGLTLTGDIPGTLRYMAPEQALGKRALVDRRTDIYALGATLYELLTLGPAVPGTDKQEILRRIAEEEPPPVRRLNPAVSRDLATIVAKSMSKEPANRYETARHLVDDLTRYLDGRPIAARPVGPAVRAWRWCRRKPALASLAAALVLVLSAGVAGITWNWREAVHQQRESERRGELLLMSHEETARERDLKELQRARAEAVNRFLIDELLGQANPSNNSAATRITLIEALDRAEAKVGASFTDQPEIEASIRMAIGEAEHGLGRYGKSEAQYRAAWALLAARPGGPGADGFEALANLGDCLTHLDRLDEAEPTARRAAGEIERLLGPRHKLTLKALTFLANVEQVRSRYPEAEAINRRVLDTRRELLGPRHQETLRSLNNVGCVLKSQAKFRDAEQIFRQCLELRRSTAGDEHPDTLTAQHNLGDVLVLLGRFNDAEALLRPCLDARRRVLGPDHPYVLLDMFILGKALRGQGKHDEAEKMLRDCLEARRRVLGPTYPETLETAGELDALLKARATPPAR
ncbi:serine/threonine-protein kinase [Aquisphaera insulae]|uniref:serine/threonine-protein kinase n=1 Tax=Aquisphaera insulae TaxID=2712864 RepID=UPI00196B56B9|nr:serine/threonine-protein kinase [Aquisphaera insulae]